MPSSTVNHRSRVVKKVRHENVPQILEREEELAALTALARDAANGRGTVAVVDGPAGIGKTRLLAEAQARARSLGICVLAARGSELERDFAFGIVRQLLEEPVQSTSAEQRRSLLAGAARTAAALVDGRGARPRAAQQTQDAFAVIHGLYWLCANLAALTPLLIVVDDVQWCDEPSLRWLHFLCGRIEELAALVLIANRTDEPGTRPPVLAQVMAEQVHRSMSLTPLTEDAVSALVRTDLGGHAATEFCRACHASSGGNPYYLKELLHAIHAQRVEPTAEAAAWVRQQGPHSIGDAVLRRIDRRGSDPTALARAIAVLGRGANLNAAAQLGGLDSCAAARAADQLAAMQILDASGSLDFVHPIVRSAIYAEIPHWERARLHRRAASLLVGEGRLEAVAGQLLESEPNGEVWAVQVLRDAAREALARGAPEGAFAYLRRAVAEPAPRDEEPAMLRELGQAAFLSGDGRWRDYLRRALNLAHEPKQRAVTALALSQALVVADQLDEAVQVLRQGVVDADRDHELGMALEAQLVGVAEIWGPGVPIARAHFSRWRRAYPPATPSGRLLLASLAACGVDDGLHAAKVRELAERALGHGRLLAEVTCSAHPFYLAANALSFADWLEQARTCLDQAINQARDLGSLVGFALASCYRSDVAYRAGRLADAESDGFASLRAAAGSDWWGHSSVARGHLMQVLIERGQLEEAAALLREESTEVGRSDSTPQMLGRYHRGRLLMALGRVHDGVKELLATGEWHRRAGWRNPSLWAWRSDAALGLATLGRLQEARHLAWEEVGLARPLGQPRTLGMALRAAGLLEGGGRGLELVQEAVEVLADGPSRLEHARALIDLGRLYRHRGHRIEARRALTEGLDLAHRCGATVLVGSAKNELRLAGARPRRLRTTGLMALTAAERRVAQMAGEGLSNPDIAQAQFIGLKTVETHLSRVYSKLGITSRSALPAALARPVDEEPE